MAAKTISMSTLKQVLRLSSQGKSIKYIARTVGLSRNTVKKYLRLCEICELPKDQILGCEDEELKLLINPGAKANKSDRYQNFKEQLDYLLKELKRPHVTRRLLWIEYKKQYPSGYERSQFCYHLHEAEKSQQVSMVISHAPGDMLFVDFAGKTWKVHDGQDGQPSEKQVFIATLGYSQYSYVEAVDSQRTEDFIAALSRCLHYYGGVPKAIVPDNLKAAVIKTDRFEPKLNRVLEDFANHYGTTILPARSAKPKDKALVENMVKHSYSHIYGPLRNQKFYDLNDLNEAIAGQLTVYNEKRFHGRDYSRYERFITQEKPSLSSMPPYVFQLKKYRRLKVQKNAHILLSEDHHYYSVPYAYIGKRTQVIYTHSTVSVYFQSKIIASHVRNKRPYGYTSVAEHLPSHFQNYKDRSPDYYLKWAATKNPDILLIIQKVLAQRKHPEQTYRTCDGIKHLAAKTNESVFNNACRIAVEYGCYQYGFIKTLIENGMTDQVLEHNTQTSAIADHKNIRGKQYYQNQLL